MVLLFNSTRKSYSLITWVITISLMVLAISLVKDTFRRGIEDKVKGCGDYVLWSKDYQYDPTRFGNIKPSINNPGWQAQKEEFSKKDTNFRAKSSLTANRDTSILGQGENTDYNYAGDSTSTSVQLSGSEGAGEEMDKVDLNSLAN